MNQWAFVWAAYAVALCGTLGLVAWTAGAMRRAERSADQAKRR